MAAGQNPCKKQMPKEALKILKKAKEIAYRYDNEKALLEILFLERNILMVTPDKHVFEKEDIYEEHNRLRKDSKQVHYVTFRPDGYVVSIGEI
jgi:hypothetical protein